MWSFAVLLASLTALVSFDSHAACSSYAGATSGPITGKISINEYNYSGNFIEIRIIDPTIVTETANFNGWMLSVFKKSGGGGSTRTDYPVQTAYLSAAGCGTASNYIRVSTGTLSNDSVVVLWSDSAMTQELDYFRIGQSAYPTFQASTCFASSEFPSATTVTFHQAALAENAARKDVARGPDGTGQWIETPYNGADQGTSCNTNDATLAITKSANLSSLYVGEQVTFRVTVTLDSRAQAQTSVQVVDLLPSGLAYVSHSASSGTYTSSTGVWSIGSLSAGASVTLDITAKATLVGAWTNSASVSSSNFPAGTVGAATAVVTVLQPLVLTKTVSPTSVFPGGSATFTVTVSNRSSAALPASFTVNDTVPAGLTLGTPSATVGSSYSAGVWTINSGMAAGSSYQLTLPVTAPGTPGSFTNTATSTPFGSATTLSASATLTVATVSNFNAFESSTAAGATSGRIYTKLAGAAFDLDVVVVAGGSQSSGFGGNVKVELLANAGTPGSGYGVDNCPNSNSAVQSIASTAVSGGRSKVSFAAVAKAYRDVRVRISYPATAPTVVSCSSDSFAIRPVAVNLSTTPAMATPPSASASPTLKAGASFTLIATTGVADGYGGVLTQDASKLGAQTTVQDTAMQVGGVVGVLSPATLTANAAPAPSNNASYSEAGYLYAAAGALRDDSFTAVDQNQPAGCDVASTCDCLSDTTTANYLSDALVGSSGRYGCSVGNASSVSFGRFIPDHFTISAAALTAACSSGAAFTYFGQDGFTTAFTLSAQNAANATTQNYAGVFAKLDLTQYANYGFGAAPLPAGSNLSSSATAPSGAWVKGVAGVSVKHQISRPPAATGETSISISAAPTDGEVAASAAAAVGSMAKLRYGRLVMKNAYGSERLDLPVPLLAQYWTGSYYVVNTDDSCTVIPMSSITMGNYIQQLNACETRITPAGNLTLVAGKLPAAGVILSKPGPGNAGSVDIALNVGATAAGKTCVSATESNATAANMPWFGANPAARATFGIYKAPMIYQRENY